MQIITATIPQYANGNFFIQAAGSNISEIAGSISTFGTFAAPVLPNTTYGITILPPQGTSYSRFGTMFVSGTEATLDISDILDADIPPPVSLGIELQTNGIDNELQTKLNLIDGTNVTLTVDEDGGVTVAASGGGSGSVTHSLGPLTAGSLIMGNGAGDITTVPGTDWNISLTGFLTLPQVNISTPTTFPFLLQSSNTSATAVTIANNSTNFEYAIGVTGTALTTGGGGMFIEGIGGKTARYLYMYETDSTHPVMQTGALGVWGWSSNNSALVAVADAGLSRKGPATVAIGNGTQGDASGQAQFATHLGPAVAPTGSGPAGAWSFSQDGKISFCNAGTWEQIVP